MRESASQTKWIQLEIISTQDHVNHGFVEFRAHYIINNKKQILHEVSEFKFENGKWYYVDGKWKTI
jgi:SEC-C motif-containing protein